MVTILVVEDDEYVRHLVVRILSAAGHKVETAEDGVDGLDRAQSLPELSLVVSDQNMPRKSGSELVQDLRSFERFLHLPVIMMTTGSFQEDFQGFIESHQPCAFLEKPFRKPDLLEAVDCMLAEATRH